MKRITLTILAFFMIALSCISAEKPRWVGQPIYVYIPQYGNMSVLMKQAFMEWENKSKGTVRFKFVPTPTSANIEVEFVDFVANCNDAGAVGCTEMITRAGQYYKSFVTIGTKQYRREFVGGQYIRKIETRPKNNIYGVMIHEAGHAIGLGHSSSAGSIMYPYDLDSMQYVTNEDLKLLYNKYH